MGAHYRLWSCFRYSDLALFLLSLTFYFNILYDQLIGLPIEPHIPTKEDIANQVREEQEKERTKDMDPDDPRRDPNYA